MSRLARGPIIGAYALGAAALAVALVGSVGGASAAVSRAVAIANGSVGTAKLADGAVTTPKLANGSVNAAKLAANAVGNAALRNGAVTATKIGANAIDATKIKNGSIGRADIAAGTFLGAKSKAVNADKIDGLDSGAFLTAQSNVAFRARTTAPLSIPRREGTVARTDSDKLFGKNVIIAKLQFNHNGAIGTAGTVSCKLRAGKDVDGSDTAVARVSDGTAQGSVVIGAQQVLTMIHDFGSVRGTVRSIDVRCTTSLDAIEIGAIDIVSLRVSRSVDGTID